MNMSQISSNSREWSDIRKSLFASMDKIKTHEAMRDAKIENLQAQIDQLTTQLEELKSSKIAGGPVIQCGHTIWFASKQIDVVRGYIVSAPNDCLPDWHCVRPSLGDGNGASVLLKDINAYPENYYLEDFSGDITPFKLCSLPY
jgi:hypothetical protein